MTLNNSNINKFYTVPIGALASTCSIAATAPLDRMTIQFHLSNKKMRVLSVAAAMRKNYKQLGLRSFWWGASAQFLKLVPFNILRFGLFDYYRSKLGNSHSQTFTSGSLAGVSAVVGTYPLDYLRTRLAAQKETKEYKNIVYCFKKVVKRQGVLSLYRGLLPSCISIIPYCGTSFLVNEELKQRLNLKNHYSPIKRLACGTLAGFSGVIFSFPFNIVRRRMQQSTQKLQMRHVIKQVFHEGGARAFYKGFGICWVNSTLSVAISLTVFDLGKKFLKIQEL